MFRRVSLAAVAVFSSLVFAACTTGSGNARLENLADIPPTTGDGKTKPVFPGVVSDQKGASPPAVRYIFHTHGMGMTDANSVLIRPVTLALEQAGYTLETTPAESPWIDAPTAGVHKFEGEALFCEGGAALRPPCLYDHFGQYRVDRFVHTDGKSRVVVYSYFWHDDLWRLQRPFLDHDLGGLQTGFAGWTSGSLTRELKTSIVNEGLSDVAAYLGPAGKPLTEGMSSAICIMLREAERRPVTTAEHDSTIALSPSKCLDADGAKTLRDSDVRISFISHSLGSRMLFDVLGADDSNTKAPSESLQALESATDTFFMAANQLALLGIAKGVTPVEVPSLNLEKAEREVQNNLQQDCASDLPSFFTVRCRAQSVAKTLKLKKPDRLNGRALWVIGFFDPGDFLGYSLMGGRAGKAPTDIRFISVLHRNTPQILKLISNPMEAHDNELALEVLARPGVGHPRAHHAPPYPNDRPTEVFKSPNAVAMIFCGARSDPEGRLTPEKCLSR